MAVLKMPLNAAAPEGRDDDPEPAVVQDVAEATGDDRARDNTLVAGVGRVAVSERERPAGCSEIW